MRKQNPCKGNDRSEEPAQRLADLLHLGPRRRQQVDFKVLGKRFAKGSVRNGLADRLGATSAQERGTRTPFLQFLHQTRCNRLNGGRLARASGAEQSQVAAMTLEKAAHPIPGPIKGRKPLIVRVFGTPNQLLDIGRNAAADPCLVGERRIEVRFDEPRNGAS